MDTWTASIVDLSYPLALSCFWRLDVPSVISAVSVSDGGGPIEIGRGGCKSEDWDGFTKALMRAPPSTVMVVGPEAWPENGSVVNGGMGGNRWVLSGFLT